MSWLIVGILTFQHSSRLANRPGFLPAFSRFPHNTTAAHNDLLRLLLSPGKYGACCPFGARSAQRLGRPYGLYPGVARTIVADPLIVNPSDRSFIAFFHSIPINRELVIITQYIQRVKISRKDILFACSCSITPQRGLFRSAPVESPDSTLTGLTN